MIKDNDDKLPQDVKTEVQGDVDALKSALAGDDDDAVKTAFEKLQTSQTKIGEAIYKQAQESEAHAGADASTGGQAGGAEGAAASDEDVVDAEVVEDDEEAR
jgi:molecular chaperone DnaK